MIVTRLSTRAFRNLSDVTLAPHARFNVLAGDNAQGKTNALEAVYLLGMQRSFRATRTQELIRFGAEEASVSGRCVVGPLERDVELQLKPTGRRVLVDGKGTRAGSSKLEGLAAVLFTPDDLAVPRGSPSGRRQLLDRAIQTVWPGYAALQRDYAKTLASRNRVLRDGLGIGVGSSGSRDANGAGGLGALLQVYDAQLCQLGAKVIAARRRYLDVLAPRFAEVFDRISGAGEKVELRYEHDDGIDEHSDQLPPLRDALATALHAARARDIARKSTTVGPHTHDLAFDIDGRPARQYGSQGQVRSLVLAFRISQILDSYDKLGHYPVLLLDDVSSELDAQRNGFLFDFIREITCQVFITTTRPALIELADDRKDFQVVRGVVSG